MDKPIKLNRVEKAYSGKSHECYCGCSGKYWYPTEEHPYSEEVSLAKVKRIVNKLNKNAADVTSVNGEIYTLTIGKHDWTVYLKPYSNLDYLEEKYEEKLALDKITII